MLINILATKPPKPPPSGGCPLFIDNMFDVVCPPIYWNNMFEMFSRGREERGERKGLRVVRMRGITEVFDGASGAEAC